MKKLCTIGVLAGLFLPLTAVTEAHATGFSDPEMWVEDFAVNNGWRLDRHVRLMGDVDGDGLDDIVGFGEQGVLVSLSTGSSFMEPEMWVDNYSFSNGWRVEEHPRYLADVDDDGMLDIVGFGNAGVYVSKSTGSRFRPPQLWIDDYNPGRGWRGDRHPRYLADINGDDRLDIVGFGDEGVYVSKSSGRDFGDAELWVDDFGYEQGWRTGRHPRYLADINDDDRADIVGFGDNGVLVARAVGGRFTDPRRWADDYGYNDGWRTGRHIRLMADVSGDGRDDILGFGDRGAILSLARPNRFTDARRVIVDFGFDQGWRTARHPRMVGDIDGDEQADIVGFGQSGVVIATSRGSTFNMPYRVLDDFGYKQGWRTTMHVRLLADVNGDDLDDIVGFGDYGTIVALAEI